MQSSWAAFTAVLVVWSFVFLAGWNVIGLYSDGSDFLSELIARGRVTANDDQARLYAIALTQAPTLVAIVLETTNLKWLARVYSWTLLGVPALLYSLAIVRVRHDTTLLGLVLVAVAAIFLPSCLFSVGEYNIAYASVVVAATYLASSRPLTAPTAAFLLLLGLVNLRSYEALLYLGPLVAVLAIRIAPAPTAGSELPARSTAIIMLLPFTIAALASQARHLFPAVTGTLIAAAALYAWRCPNAFPQGKRWMYLLIAGFFIAGGIVASGSNRFDIPNISLKLLWSSLRASVLNLDLPFLLMLAFIPMASWATLSRQRWALLVSAAMLALVASAALWRPSFLSDAPQINFAFQARHFCGLLAAAFVLALILRANKFFVIFPPRSVGLAAVVAMAVLNMHAVHEWGSLVGRLQREMGAARSLEAIDGLSYEIRRWYVVDPNNIQFLPSLSQLIRLSSAGDREATLEAGKQDLPAPIAARFRWRD